jgi:hypothetical protein
MKLLLAIPVTRRSLITLAKAVPVLLVGLVVMWTAFGLVGAVVLTVLLVLLGRLLLQAARAQ